jgi:hypothetical protein
MSSQPENHSIIFYVNFNCSASFNRWRYLDRIPGKYKNLKQLIKLTVLYPNDCSYAKISPETGGSDGSVSHEIDEHPTAGIQVNPVWNGTAAGSK